MQTVNPVIDEEWKNLLTEEFARPYFAALREKLVAERQLYQVYPPGGRIFAAFNHTPPQKVKVVILGQDPYHGAGQANGLCFSVAGGIRKPPSLENIFKELRSDLGIPVPVSGNLEKWALQGVLLLNATLTVRANSPNSHAAFGWQEFTDAVISGLSKKYSGIVFMLWGRFAQGKEQLIETPKHFILKAAHPSPFSASAGFFGCRHFSKANAILKELGKEPVDWSL